MATNFCRMFSSSSGGGQLERRTATTVKIANNIAVHLAPTGLAKDGFVASPDCLNVHSLNAGLKRSRKPRYLFDFRMLNSK
jgi:hypothetical protein